MASPLLDEKYAGVWSRTLIHVTEGGAHEFDTTTTVRWVQSRRYFGDVRVPAPVAAVTAPLSQCGEAELALLATQNAFAGHTGEALDPGGATSVLTWERCVNWQPPGGPPDTGRARWVNANKIYEDDLDGVAYHEVWERLPESAGASYAVRLQSASGPARLAFLIVAGDCFVFVADRVTPLAAPPSGEAKNHNSLVEAAVAALPTLQAKRDALSLEASYGRVAAAPGHAAWRIETSVLPARAGQSLFGAEVTRESLLAAAASGAAVTAGEFCPPGGWLVLPEPEDDDAAGAAGADIDAASVATVATSRYQLQGRTVVITGLAGGIGRGLGAAFAAQGATVVAVDRDAALLDAVCARLRRDHAAAGAVVHACTCDLSSDESVESLAARIGAELLGPSGRVDCIVNNAGVENPTPLRGAGTMAFWSAQLDNNVTSMMRLTRALLPLMGNGSSVINQSSIWGLTAVADFSAYCASKHAVLGVTRSLAFELGPQGIRVNAVCPGWIRTAAAMRSLVVMAKERGVSDAVMEAEIVGKQAIAKFLDPADIAAVYLYLACDDSSSLTGQALCASRGEVMH